MHNEKSSEIKLWPGFFKVSNMMDFFCWKVSLVKKGPIITVRFLQISKPRANRLYWIVIISEKNWFCANKLKTPQRFSFFAIIIKEAIFVKMKKIIAENASIQGYFTEVCFATSKGNQLSYFQNGYFFKMLWWLMIFPLHQLKPKTKTQKLKPKIQLCQSYSYVMRKV